ncbi:MAG: ABC transporter ATP-binding protein [Dehalococcoidia bacterium]
MTAPANSSTRAGAAGAPVVELEAVSRHFRVRTGGILSRKAAVVRAVDDVSLSIGAGQTLGVVGESGCGKTTLARLILRDIPLTSGHLRFGGRALDDMSHSERAALTHSVGAVFQDPFSSLNPRHRVSTIVTEPDAIVRGTPRGKRRVATQELLRLVGLPANAADLYPHEFSGGQRQRIAIARALSVNPDLLILDEPISALDVSIRAQIINLLKDVQDAFNLAYVFIAHDLASVYHMADRVAVMYLGQVVEVGETIELYSRPAHPYTQALLSASLPINPRDRKSEVILGGEVPSPLNPPSGCRFHPRCPLAFDRCKTEQPPLDPVAPDHGAACFLADQLHGGARPDTPPSA